VLRVVSRLLQSEANARSIKSHSSPTGTAKRRELHRPAHASKSKHKVRTALPIVNLTPPNHQLRGCPLIQAVAAALTPPPHHHETRLYETTRMIAKVVSSPRCQRTPHTPPPLESPGIT